MQCIIARVRFLKLLYNCLLLDWAREGCLMHCWALLQQHVPLLFCLSFGNPNDRQSINQILHIWRISQSKVKLKQKSVGFKAPTVEYWMLQRRGSRASWRRLR